MYEYDSVLCNAYSWCLGLLTIFPQNLVDFYMYITATKISMNQIFLYAIDLIVKILICTTYNWRD